MKVVILSAGFKYGLPRANHIFDVTSCPNPRRGPSLAREHYDAWMEEQPAIQQRIEAILQYILAVAELEPGVFAICCTGGQHRSVFIADRVARRLQSVKPEWEVVVHHIDAWVE